jgi:hypothetical protein
MKMENIIVWFRNFSKVHERLMAKYLEKRGWIVFYLDEQSRHCGYNNEGCWLRLYQSTRNNS